MVVKKFAEKIDLLDKEILSAKKEKGLIQACSKCGSTNLTITQNPAKVYFRELKSYYCRDCKFEGIPILKKF